MISLALCEDSKFKIQNCIDTTLNLEPEIWNGFNSKTPSSQQMVN